MIESVLGKSVAANLSTGGTVDGDLTITGNLGVAGDASINLTSVVSNSTIIDATGAEALLVRANSDGGDVLAVNTSAPAVSFGVDDTGAPIADAQPDHQRLVRLPSSCSLSKNNEQCAGQAAGSRDRIHPEPHCFRW